MRCGASHLSVRPPPTAFSEPRPRALRCALMTGLKRAHDESPRDADADAASPLAHHAPVKPASPAAPASSASSFRNVSACNRSVPPNLPACPHDSAWKETRRLRVLCADAA